MLSPTNIWILILLSLLASFLFSGIESAILSVSRVRLRHLAKETTRGEKLAQVLDDRQRILVPVLLLTATVNLAAFALITKVTVDALGPWGYLVAFAISLPVYVFWVELLPKSIFKRFPYRLLSLNLPVLRFIDFTAGNLLRALSWIPRHSSAGGQEIIPERSPFLGSREEFKSLTRVFEREGRLNPEETRMIRSVLDFHAVRVSDVMIPLSKVTAIPLDMPVSTVMTLAKETDLDQFPVLSAEGEVVGLLDIRAFLRAPTENARVINYVRHIVMVRPEEYGLQVTARMRRAGILLAVVNSPKGRPLGIVSAEDLIQRMIQGRS